MVSLFFLISFIFGSEARILENQCKVFINYKYGHLQEPQPLILLQDFKSYNFLYPQKKTGELTLASSENFILSCPGKNNFIQGIPGLNTTEIEVKCLKGITFITRGIKFNFTSITCNRLPYHEARREKIPCFENASHIKIGFQLKKNFLTTVEVCRDDKTLSTHYTKYLLTKKIGAYHAGFPRPSKWISGDFYGKYNMNMWYKTKRQVMTLSKLLDSDELANEYINASRSRFIARGHLTAKADFVYGSVQMSTFWYLNVAPQWQTFNGGNWNSLEDNLRRFADRESLNLIVYTGTFGQMSLSDENNNQVNVYLYVNGGEYGIPVPRFFWKIIYDPERMLGTAFVGLNDPYAEEITEDMFICEDIAERIEWLTWDSYNIYKGISYACSISDLQAVIPYVPELKVKGLLY